MKKIAIVLFTAVLTSCGAGSQKCEGTNCDSTVVVSVDTNAVTVDTTATPSTSDVAEVAVAATTTAEVK